MSRSTPLIDYHFKCRWTKCPNQKVTKGVKSDNHPCAACKRLNPELKICTDWKRRDGKRQLMQMEMKKRKKKVGRLTSRQNRL